MFGPTGHVPYSLTPRLTHAPNSRWETLHFSQASQRRAPRRPDLVSRAYSVRIARYRAHTCMITIRLNYIPNYRMAISAMDVRRSLRAATGPDPNYR